MNFVKMNSQASEELKRILTEKNIDNRSIRVFMSGMG